MPSIRLGIAGAFLIGVLLASPFVSGVSEGLLLIAVAAAIGAYMALNIGANDVANSMGPPVGSGAITMTGALIIAAIGNTAGAVIAGGDVVSTIAQGIIDPGLIDDTAIFVTAMLAALAAAALWLNLATYIGAPVSTTHAIVGGVMGSGMAAVGVASVNWPTLAKIAASWVISPVLGGVIAALFLSFIRHTIIHQDDLVAAARRWVPVLVGIMGAAFAMYLMIKGLKRIWKPGTEAVIIIGALAFFATWFAVRPLIARQSQGLENRKKSIHRLFAIPLICAAAMLTFAHGANDVANAVGPLAAIVGTMASGAIAAKVAVPFWILLVGGLGISIGLALFGPRLVRTVGRKITKLNPIRAYCVALSAAITVLIASALGLPVSSTHIAVGGVFGVGFLREMLHNRARVRREALAAEARKKDKKTAEPKKKRKKLKLVRRKHVGTIVAAWLVTVPLAAILSGVLFFA
ncbi:MAG: inorganic phosphate transporter, partial [Rhodospirillales bacterium]|nr:inorganic phosphate transporter [Rhodospirillales bacterium]